MAPFSYLVGLLLLVLLPLVFSELMLGALGRLHIDPSSALLIVIGMFVGGLVNIPVRRVVREEWVSDNPLSLFGLSRYWPQLQRARRETIVAVNVGGCLIPTGLAVYELVHIAALGNHALLVTGLVSLVNTIVCYAVARPIKGVGIVLPGLVPALLAAGLALLLAPGAAAPIAFVAGVAGPLIGADLLHLREIERSQTGLISIGGAGTFDGIVLSGIVAAYLA